MPRSVNEIGDEDPPAGNDGSDSSPGTAGFGGQIATHFVGPTWQSNSGSAVVGKKLLDRTPDPTAIPWLLLSGSSSHGPGPLDGTTYIQRTNTTGGLAPSDPGTAGQIVKVPYTAEYYFYKKD